MAGNLESVDQHLNYCLLKSACGTGPKTNLPNKDEKMLRPVCRRNHSYLLRKVAAWPKHPPCSL
eukprot:4693218-Amphidinium_carterae.1